MQTTKDIILNAAKKLFVQHGFAGTSMSKIAAEADVNHSLIFHHFKNKAQLWNAVKQAIVLEARDRFKTLPDSSLPLRDFLNELFNQNLNFYRNHSDLVRILNWQRLEPASSEEIGITLNPETQRWLDALSHYQTQGEIAANLKPEFILTFVLSLISSAALDPNIFIREPAQLQAYIDFCVERLIRLLQ